MKFTSAFLELFKKAKVDKRLGFHWNGPDNLYPTQIEDLINESVTALRCSKLMSAYIIGKGFEGNNSLIVNKKENLTLFEFGNDVAESISNHRGVFIHVNWNIEKSILDMNVLPFADCRLGRKDSNKYSGKVLVCPDWTNAKEIKKAEKIDVFNPNPDVIQKQMDACDDVTQYKGQVFYYGDGPYTYPLSNLHPGINDASSEHQASIYKNTSLKKGFFGKTLVVTKPLVEGELSKGSETQQAEYQEQVKERKDFQNTLQKFIGAENVDGLLHLELEFEGDDLEKEIMFKNIDSNINDKLFAFTENSVRTNIRMCFNNVPSVLIDSQDGKLFSSSGGAIREMKVFYQDQTVNERIRVTQIINLMMQKYKEKPEGLLQITPLIDTTIVEPKKKEDVNNKK